MSEHNPFEVGTMDAQMAEDRLYMDDDEWWDKYGEQIEADQIAVQEDAAFISTSAAYTAAWKAAQEQDERPMVNGGGLIIRFQGPAFETGQESNTSSELSDSAHPALIAATG